MIAIPAIDLKDGKVVRLLHGNFDAEKIYTQKPEEVAKNFEESGAARIHMVDLNGALKGTPENRHLIEMVVKRVRIPIEVGGGIRDLKIAREYFSMGVRWIILGTKACLDKGFMREAFQEFGERIIVGVDARDGFIATDGWTKTTTTKALDLIQDIEKFGGKTVIYTDISKDGALQGPNLKEIEAVAKSVKIDVIASGGVGSLKDLENLNKLARPNILGVIIGKALYESKFTVAEAVKTCLQNV